MHYLEDNLNKIEAHIDTRALYYLLKYLYTRYVFIHRPTPEPLKGSKELSNCLSRASSSYTTYLVLRFLNCMRMHWALVSAKSLPQDQINFSANTYITTTAPRSFPAPTTASASISTRKSSPIRLAVTSVFAGRIPSQDWKTQPCARLTGSHKSSLRTITLVLTTSDILPPSF